MSESPTITRQLSVIRCTNKTAHKFLVDLIEEFYKKEVKKTENGNR